MSTTVLVSAFAPFPSLAFSAPSDSTIEDVYDECIARYDHLPASADLYLSPLSGTAPSSSTLSSLSGDGASLVTLRLVPRLRGGKGGFGSQLRAAGGRMSSQKTSNNDSCRDLSGRRLSTIKEGKRLAEYLEQEPARKKAAAEAQRAKLEALERKLGIDPKAGPSKGGVDEPAPLAGKKHRFDDTEYLEQSRELVENVKSAVTAGLLKKRKKAKTAHTDATATTPSKDNVPSVPKPDSLPVETGPTPVVPSASATVTSVGA
ncbi:hypothetical protein FA95DRAFT_1581969 [Auriscalpium vulgare]|uniref:Uncharacterized protein n=1 Tax=Auriscalpium vulgare TaxID=40419 RepID=A0ACB8RYL4_9AGAM|nr:hypothetical protein FA95DRAFT_1581969 [Auriscalpium vulgare]